MPDKLEVVPAVAVDRDITDALSDAAFVLMSKAENVGDYAEAAKLVALATMLRLIHDEYLATGKLHEFHARYTKDLPKWTKS